MFALVADGVVYLKADAVNTPAFEREKLGPFTYETKDGKRGDRACASPRQRAPRRARKMRATTNRAGRKAAGRKGATKRRAKT